MGSLEVVRTLCINGAARVCPAGSAEELAQGLAQGMDALVLGHGVVALCILRFLERTRGFVNPLQYSAELTVDEARSWLRSERLRGFPGISFVHRDSPARNVIETALVWSVDAAALFPASCRRRARELHLIQWEQKGLPRSVIL